MRQRCFTFAGWMLAAGASLIGVACGSGFAGNDCQASRTCADADEPAAAGEAGAAGTSAASEPEGGAASTASGSGGEPTQNEGGAPEAGAGGAVSDNVPPVVTGATPDRDADAVDPDSVVKISFSEPLSPASVNAGSVQLFDGEVAVAGTLSYAESQVTFHPDAPLGLLADYKVVVSAAVTDEAGAHLAQPFESHFSVRDGKFGTQIAVDQPSFQLAESLPMTAQGDALLAWSDRENAVLCPVLAQWFRRGVASNMQTLTAPGANECDAVAVGANADGVAAVGWALFDAAPGTYVKQYRDGVWAAGDGKVSTHGASSRFHVAVAPSGMVTFFDNGTPGSWAYRTDASGTWAKPDVLSSNATAISAPEVVFDAAGNGLAIWRANSPANVEELLSSRFTVESGKWSAATLVPGSLASGTDRRGAPALAMDANGDAMALWVKRDDTDQTLMASRFVANLGWQAPDELAPQLVPQALYDHPGLMFDGQSFVAAFTAVDGATLGTYTARFDLQQKQWSAPELHPIAAGSVTVRMPRLAGDHRGNLLLVWATGSSPSYKLVYQRYGQGNWSQTANIPDGNINNKYFAVSNYPLPLTVNDSGMGVLAWGNYDSNNHLVQVLLSSFF